MPTDNENTFGLIVSFPDDSASFVHGFEAGMLWQRMIDGREAEIVMTTHVENREVIARQATALGWSLEATSTDTEGWDETVLRKIAVPPMRPNPHGLRLVADALQTREAPDA